MTRWRVAVATVLLLVIGVPLFLPYLDAVRDLAAWPLWSEGERLLALAGNTLRLVGGVLALSLPVGILGAILLYRTDLPCRRGLCLLTVVSLFVPLPLFASGWQAALGSTGLFSLVTPENGPWRPWDQGLRTAIWIHAVAGLPWVVWIVGRGLCWVERELEEDALLAMRPARVLRHVTLRRSAAAIGAAAIWVALQTATEVTVTDMMQVRTYAEEVYNQFVTSDRALIPRLVAVSMPSVIVAAILIVTSAHYWERRLPPRAVLIGTPRIYKLSYLRSPCFLILAAGVGTLVLVPLLSLLWKAGLAGSPVHWSLPALRDALFKAGKARSGLVWTSLQLAAAAGAVTGILALIACRLAVESRGFRLLVLLLMAVAWATPAPVIGVGLKQTIELLLRLFPVRPVADVLYYGPSCVPGVWVDIVRFFPCAVAILWPFVRLLPQELSDAARVDGARPWQEMVYVVFPIMRPALLLAALAVAVLSLGELGAGKLVETPGSETFAHELFSQMHYGTDRDVSALCLLLLIPVMAGGFGVALVAAMRRLVKPEEWAA
jgi:iron(III) transport system permease protein